MRPQGRPAAAARPGSLHRYAYGDNNPVNLVDPSGLAGQLPQDGFQGSEDPGWLIQPWVPGPVCVPFFPVPFCTQLPVNPFEPAPKSKGKEKEQKREKVGCPDA